MPTRCIRSIAISTLFLGALAVAEEAAETPAEETPAEVTESTIADALGRETPRGSMTGYFEAADAGDFETAARFLDQRNLPREARSWESDRLARRLKVVLDRKLWIDVDSLSDDPEGFLADSLPKYRDLLGEIDGAEGKVTLLLQRVPGDSDLFIWKISNATVGQIPALYAQWGYPVWADWLRHRVPKVRFLDVELFKWVSGFSVAFLSLPVLLAVGWGLAKVTTIHRPHLFTDVRHFFMVPVSATLFFVITGNVMLNLGIGGVGQDISRAKTLTTIGVTWILLTAVNLTRKVYSEHLVAQGRSSSMVLLKPIGSAVKTTIVVLAALTWMDNAGFEITALLTGLGIGGVAVALVLQKPLEDVFGAVTLYTQQPIRIGDYGMFAGIAGTIEEISLRNTRVRTLANTLVTIPNAKLAAEPIENYSARQKILYRTPLRIRTDTEPDQVRNLLQGIERLLAEHEEVINDDARVRLVRLGEDAIELEIFAYVSTQEFVHYLEVAEELNLSIIDAVAAAGTTLAVPAHSLTLEGAASA